MASNRRWRWPFRCRGSRRTSAVAQLFSLGVMDILKDIIALLIGLTALATAIVVMRTQIIKYKCQQNKSPTPDTMPKPSTQISTSIQGNSLWSRMTLFERIVALLNLFIFPFCLVTLVFLLWFAPSAPATFREVVFIGLLIAMAVISSRRYDT